MSAPSTTLFEKLPILGKEKFTVGQNQSAETALASWVKHLLEQIASKATFYEHGRGLLLFGDAGGCRGTVLCRGTSRRIPVG